MCEKRTRKIKKGSNITRLHQARRIQRIRNLAAPAPVDNPTPPPCPPTVDKTVQNRVILELAWKTIALMQKNKIIQQKIVALKKETSEFVASVMNNPENQRRYLEHLRLNRSNQQTEKTVVGDNINNITVKLYPNA